MSSPLPGTARTVCPSSGWKYEHQLEHVVWKVVRVAVQRAPQGARGRRIAARCAAETQIDAAGKQRLERAELLRDQQRRVIRQHDPAGTDPDRLRARRDVRHDDAGRGARDAGHIVMLGNPVALVAPAFSVLREIE